MRKHFTTDTTSRANSFLMLVMVVGMLNVEPFASDGVSGYNDRRVLYHTELVFSDESLSQSPLLFISEEESDDDVEDHILSSDFHIPFFDSVQLLIQNRGAVITRPICSAHNRRSSNIPHQNSDEDEAFILSVDVA